MNRIGDVYNRKMKEEKKHENSFTQIQNLGLKCETVMLNAEIKCFNKIECQSKRLLFIINL